MKIIIPGITHLPVWPFSEYNMKLDNLVANFEQARADGKGSDDYKEVAKSVSFGFGKIDRISMLSFVKMDPG